MLAVGLAFASAIAYGVSDFVGGLRSRTVHFLWVTVLSQTLLTIGVLAWLPFRPGVPTPEAILWGGIGAFGHVLGTLMLMRGLSSGAMHVAGPLSAVTGSGVPVLVGVLDGERPGMLAWVGIALALPAVWLVAAGGPDASPDVAAGPGVPAGVDSGGRLPAGARDGVLAGVGFALFFVAIARPDAATGAWPLVTLEAAALVLVLALTTWKRPPGRLVDALPSWPTGLLALAGVVLYFLATHAGMLSIVVVVCSLYPAFTVLLAMSVLGERPSGRQVAGLAAAAASVMLIASSGV